jgi:hypothetical protein
MLRRYFENLQMTNSKAINYFLTGALSIVNQIKFHGDTLNDQKVVENILRILPVRIDPIDIAIEESKDLSQVFIDELMGSLQTHEKRLNRLVSSPWKMHSNHKFNLATAEAQEEEEPVTEVQEDLEEEELETTMKEADQVIRMKKE